MDEDLGPDLADCPLHAKGGFVLLFRCHWIVGYWWRWNPKLSLLSDDFIRQFPRAIAEYRVYHDDKQTPLAPAQLIREMPVFCQFFAVMRQNGLGSLKLSLPKRTPVAASVSSGTIRWN